MHILVFEIFYRRHMFYGTYEMAAVVLPAYRGLKLAADRGFVTRYKGAMKLFVHNKGSNNRIVAGFDVLQSNSYLSFELLSHCRVARI